MKLKVVTAAAACAIMAMSAPAMAQQTVSATTDLNVRAGPGPHYPVIGVINVDEQAMLMGCAEASKWCQVDVNGTQGWAYSDYLIGDSAGVEVVVTERPPEMEVPVVVYEEQEAEGGEIGGLAGGTAGAVAGAIVGGPIGAAVGGIAGAAGGGIAGDIIDPAPPVRTYIEANPHDPVYLEGEVVVGASLPETVEVYEIPDYEYRYVYVNGQPVLVEAETRRIVHVVR